MNALSSIDPALIDPASIDPASIQAPTDTMALQMQEAFAQTWAREMGPGEAAPALLPDTVLLDTGLDSLGFAIFVSDLEDIFGYDPFALAEDLTVYPQTFAEFVAFYEANRPKG